MLSTLSVTSVTSGRICSAAKFKLTTLIVMTIFNNGIKFRIGDEETFRAMNSASGNVSKDKKLIGRKTV